MNIHVGLCWSIEVGRARPAAGGKGADGRAWGAWPGRRRRRLARRALAANRPMGWAQPTAPHCLTQPARHADDGPTTAPSLPPALSPPRARPRARSRARRCRGRTRPSWPWSLPSRPMTSPRTKRTRRTQTAPCSSARARAGAGEAGGAGPGGGSGVWPWGLGGARGWGRSAPMPRRDWAAQARSCSRRPRAAACLLLGARARAPRARRRARLPAPRLGPAPQGRFFRARRLRRPRRRVDEVDGRQGPHAAHMPPVQLRLNALAAAAPRAAPRHAAQRCSLGHGHGCGPAAVSCAPSAP
jgi:hypothetical protein